MCDVSAELVSLARLMFSNLIRRPWRSSVLMLAVGIFAAMGFLSIVLVGSLQQSLLHGFERLGADLLVVRPDAQVNLTQALLTVVPDAPPLATAVLEAADLLHLAEASGRACRRH